MEGKLYSVAQAAEAWGISRQAVYQRLNKLTKEGYIVVKGNKRYITRDCIEAYLPARQGVEQQVEQQVEQELTTNQPTLDKLTKEIEQAKADLLAEQGRANALQATADAQKAHIDSLKDALEQSRLNADGLRIALDREQALHMATLQRLPAGRTEAKEGPIAAQEDPVEAQEGPAEAQEAEPQARGFFAWLKGRKGKA